MGKYTDLEQTLVGKGVDLNYVRINRYPSDSTYCILDDGNGIEVFWFERGAKRELRTFSDADEAINFFMSAVLSNPHVFTRAKHGA